MSDIDTGSSSSETSNDSGGWDDEDTSSNTSSNSSSNDDDLFDDVKDARKDEPKAKPKVEAKDKEVPKPAKRFVKANVNGREETVDEETLIRHYQKERAAEERFEKANRIEKQTQSFIEALKADPAKVLTDPRLGVNMREVAMKILSQQVEEELIDPKEKETNDLRTRLKDYEDREANDRQTREEAEHTERHQRAVNERKSHFKQTFEKAMELSPLARDPDTAAETVAAMAREYRLAKAQGYEATPEELAQAVESRHMKSMQTVAHQLSGEELLSFFGPKILKKIRDADIAQMEGRVNSFKPTKSESPSWTNDKPAPTSNKTIDPTEWRLKSRDLK